MKTARIFFFTIFLISPPCLALSDHVWERQLQKSHSASDSETFQLLQMFLGDGYSHLLPNPQDESRRRSQQQYFKAQKILMQRSGFVQPLVDDLIVKHKKAVTIYRDPNASWTETRSAITDLRKASHQIATNFRFIPSNEIIRQVGRLYEVPRWTYDEILELEGPEFSKTYADATKAANLVFGKLIEKDERFLQIWNSESSEDITEAWQIWFKDIANGKENFRFKGNEKEVNLFSRTSSATFSADRQQNRKQKIQKADDTNTTGNENPLNSLLFAMLSSTIVAIILWWLYESAKSKD